eukprot:350549-Pelagomonas_calceolata.AAC.1
MGAGSFLKGKPGGVTKRIAFNVDAREVCFSRGVITLNSLVMAMAPAFVPCDFCISFDLFGGFKKGHQWRCGSGPGEKQLLLQLIQPLQWYW